MYVFTSDIFNKIYETEADVGGKTTEGGTSKIGFNIRSQFEGKTYGRKQLEWLKTSIKFTLEDNEFKDE